jgi:DNA-binding winged helix-turn-helix (wHTH) protein/TolB-like protein
MNEDSGPHKEPIRFGQFVLDPARCELLRDGAPVALRRQSFDVLSVLVANHGRLVTKEEIHDRVWGNIATTDDSIAQCISEIRRALGDSSREIVRTVPRRGYIFGEDVQPLPAGPGVEASPATAVAWRMPAIFAVATTILVLALLWLIPGNEKLPGPRPVPTAASVAVLPFVDSGHPLSPRSQPQLGTAFSDELRDQLSRVPGLRVAARTSSLAIVEQESDIRKMAGSLGVAALIEGDFRQQGAGLRISVRLVDGQSGLGLWAQTYQQRSSEILAVQQDVAEKILRYLLPAADYSPPATTPSATANGLILQARYLEEQIRAQPEVDQDALFHVIRLYREATTVDPESALAYSRLAAALLYAGDPGGAEAPIFKALTLNPDLSEVQVTLGKYYWARKLPGAGAAWKRAVELNPNDADALAAYAHWYWMQGYSDGPAEMFRHALELDPLSLSRHADLGNFLGLMGRVDETEELIRRIQSRFHNANAYRVIAWLEELNGALDKSIAWSLRARDLEPGNPLHIWATAELYADIGDFDTALTLEPQPGVALLFKMRRYEELIDMGEKLMREQPDDLLLQYLVAFAYNAIGRYAAAVSLLESAGLPGTVLPESRQASDMEAFISYVNALAGAGNTSRAMELASWWHDRQHTTSSSWWTHLYNACATAVLGLDAEALDKLAVIESSPRLPWQTALLDSPCFQRYATEPVYLDVLAKVEQRRAALRRRLPETLESFGVKL